MKFIIFIFLSYLIISCNSNKNTLFTQQQEYKYDNVTAAFVRNTRVTTFLKNGKPISGIVIQELRNGGKNVWEVEKGLATKQTVFYPNGQMRRMLEMQFGVEHGTFVIFFSDGQKFIERFYVDGEPTGTWHKWNRDGELVETIEY